MNFLGRLRRSLKAAGVRGTAHNIKIYFTSEVGLVVEAAISPFLINRVIGEFEAKSKGLKTSDKLADFAIHFKSFPVGIKAYQTQEQLLYLAKLLKKLKPKNMMEIGTAHGGSLFFFSRLSAPGAKILSINLPFAELNRICLQQRYKLYRKFATRGQKVYIFEADSHKGETLERARVALGGSKLDYLFIDGDHSYEGTKMDFVMYSKLVRKGGIVAFDDIGKPQGSKVAEPRRAYDEVKRGHKHMEFISPGGEGLGVLYM